jgi:hypothetical protein
MIGYDHYIQIKKLEINAQRLGFKLDHAPSSNINNLLMLYPAENSLPCWDSKTAMFSGSVEELAASLAGWELCQTYLMQLKVVTRKAILRAEQDVRNRKLMQQLAKDSRNE